MGLVNVYSLKYCYSQPGSYFRLDDYILRTRLYHRQALRIASTPYSQLLAAADYSSRKACTLGQRKDRLLPTVHNHNRCLAYVEPPVASVVTVMGTTAYQVIFLVIYTTGLAVLSRPARCKHKPKAKKRKTSRFVYLTELQLGVVLLLYMIYDI